MPTTATTVITIKHLPDMDVSSIINHVQCIKGVIQAMEYHPPRYWDRCVLASVLSETIAHHRISNATVADYVTKLDVAIHDRSALALIRIVKEWTGWSLAEAKAVVDRATSA
jgi:ribosomal protein L7/L12